MEKSKSYYEWELQFRKKSKNSSPSKPNGKQLNSLGIPADEFKSFLKKWEAKHFTSGNK